jgi:hypothetical protein
MTMRLALALGSAILMLSCVDTGLVGEAADAGQDGDACTSSDCTDSGRCDPDVQECVAECMDDDDCVSHEDGPFCDLERNECEQCQRDSDCEGAGGSCTRGRCRECEDDGDCARDESCDEGRCFDDDN